MAGLPSGGLGAGSADRAAHPATDGLVTSKARKDHAAKPRTAQA